MTQSDWNDQRIREHGEMERRDGGWGDSMGVGRREGGGGVERVEDRSAGRVVVVV